MANWKTVGQYVPTQEADLAPGLKLSVWWEGISKIPDGEPRYNVSVFGMRLKNRSASFEDGQRRAEAYAKRLLGAALTSLEPESAALSTKEGV